MVSRRVRIPLWVIPLIYVVLSAGTGITLPRLEHAYFPIYEHAIAVSSAQAFLSAASSGMMALTAIAFSIAFLVLQFTATAYSKRLVLLSGYGRVIVHALGMCFATFVYALAALLWVDRFRDGTVPTVTTIVVGLLLIASLVLLALLVHSLTDLRVTRVLRILGDNGRAVIAATYSLRGAAVDTSTANPQSNAASILARKQVQMRYNGPPLSVRAIDTNALLNYALNARGAIVVHGAVGDTLTDGIPLLGITGTQLIGAEPVLLSAFHLAAERTFEGDPKYPIRLLVDTAIMALSPAVNDPTTAVQALDELEDLVYRLGKSDLGNGHVFDRTGELRVIVPTPTWEDYLSLAFDEIRICGSESLQVMRRLRTALDDLSESLADSDRKAAVQRFLDELDITIEQSRLTASDRAKARMEDPQGLGLTRRPP